MSNHQAIKGRNFMKMMRPILGLDNAPGIRNMRITANYNDVTTVEIDMIARPDFDRVTAEKVSTEDAEIKTRRYTVTVTEVLE